MAVAFTNTFPQKEPPPASYRKSPHPPKSMVALSMEVCLSVCPSVHPSVSLSVLVVALVFLSEMAPRGAIQTAD